MTVDFNPHEVLRRFLQPVVERARVFVDEVFVREFRLNPQARLNFLQTADDLLHEATLILDRFLGGECEFNTTPVPDSLCEAGTAFLDSLDDVCERLRGVVTGTPDNCRIGDVFPDEKAAIVAARDKLQNVLEILVNRTRSVAESL